MRSTLGGAAFLALLVGCGSMFGGQSDDTGSAPPPPDEDAGVIAEDANASNTADAMDQPDDGAPPVTGQSDGVYVSAGFGTPDGTGTQAHPLSTIQAGIDLAAKGHRSVFVCASDTYNEALTLREGVNVFGSFFCGLRGWGHDATTSAIINAPTSPALRADGIAKETHFEDFSVNAPDGTPGAESSIVLIATSSPGLVVRAALTAGTGASGVDGTAATQLVQTGDVNGFDNVAPDVCTGFTANACKALRGTNPGGTSVCSTTASFNGGPGGTGGAGGTYYRVTDTSFSPPSYFTVTTAPTVGGGGTAQTAAGGSWHYPFPPGQPGAAGANGTEGASATTIGTLSATGYTLASGTSGTNGAPGQGGGGGSARDPSAPTCLTIAVGTTFYGGNGPSGGAGGCPGLAGTAGTGGGASIAVLAIDSPMLLRYSGLTTKGGGNGGKGTLASNPSPGGAAGHNTAGADGYEAGAGGAGGKGGNSGSGAGGPSFAVAYHGAKPKDTDAVLQPGPGGRGVAAMTHSDGRVIAASADGPSANDYEF